MPVHISHSNATKTVTPSRIYDSHRGLHLWVKSAKAKYWIFRYTKDGKRTDISLGSFPALGVSDARKKACEISESLASGIDPQDAKRSKKQAEAIPVTPVITFESFAKEIVSMKQDEWKNDKHSQQWSNTLSTYAYPVIGKMKLDEIQTDHILKILQPIWVTKTETATRLRGRIERVLSAATIKNLRTGVNPAQWRGHLELLLPQAKKLKKVKHHAALPYAQVPAFIEQLQGRDALAAMAMEFCILNASRTGEVIHAKKSEIAGDVWTIPGDRMKAGVKHQVPLCPRSLLLAAKASALDPESEYIFSKGEKPLSNMAMLSLLKRMNRTDITTHGFRSAFRDWVAEETLHSPEVAEMALAHTIANRVEAAYRRGNLLEKRRALLLDWERYCLAQHASNVMQLKRA